ncbi:DEHA2G19778p [Debaryomyces hansenii CBS767]|jgi:dihydrofolate reductase|uniref:DEHA2G19778p n=1 Tax=Debaryomyces hansenii (strain ATCC 36239 / CBS 767 / BCRC 21394 / JCM 1990 / NBRC 0083 / IGC 2968) TaxID=284592 RepID=Q6BHB8_DEBHA|nr:DEHA2G19778p [Debaryomyces hansenii CBS767]CAG90912.1 DEHA2G19778p [Debaryomyces hansenii CBS767]|eukprot:XP_462403.1 DEHA2G19778p [Debaryomyces hansenii CBS767]
MPPKNEIKFKGKILFLHGYTQSSSVFYAKTSALRKKLLKLNYKSVYLNGPTKLTPADLPSTDSLSKFNTVISDDEETNYRSWWIKPHNTNDGIDLSEPLAEIKNYIDKGEIIPDNDLVQETESDEERRLPIVGIIGFSQGAALAGLLSHKFKDLFGVDSLKFVILYSGFKIDTSEKSGNAKYKDYYPADNGESDQFKVLHIYGELDTVVHEDRVLSLYEITKDNSDILKHPGGHFVPNSKLMVDQTTNWIVHIMENKQEISKPEDDLDSLMDMMDGLGKA